MTRLIRTRAGVIAPIAMVLIVASGCAGQTETTSFTEADIRNTAQHARDAGYEAQAKLLDDGEADAEDYDTAFRRFSECITSAGFTVSEPIVSPANSLTFEYVVDTGPFDPDEADRKIDECGEEHLRYVTLAYRRSHEQRMDAALADAVAACLDQNGAQLSGDERNVQDFLDAFDNREVFDDCISNEAIKLFPDLPTLGWGTEQ